MNQKETNNPDAADAFDGSEMMPVLFIGHGSPMNAIEDNEFTKGWREVAKVLPKPKAVLCISAHWETPGTFVTAMERPRTIHDFGGFPQALFDVQYPAQGSPWLAGLVKATMQKTTVGLNNDWGLDHGTWSVLVQMFPAADIPVVQLSLDYTKSAVEHFVLAKELFALRQQGVLIMGSGNMVHNLGRMVIKDNGPGGFNKPFGLDWAIAANELFKSLINDNSYSKLADYLSLDHTARLAVTTPEHYLPLLYILALKQENETVSYFNDQIVGGALAMTSLIIDTKLKNVQYIKQMSLGGAID